MLDLSLQTFSVLLILATGVTLIPKGWKWIRIFDFPRLQTAGMIVGAIAALFAFTPVDDLINPGLVAALFLALLFQLWHIFPYTPLARVQARGASHADPDACLRLLISNVRMENRDSNRLLEVVHDADPDIAVFMETDDWWDAALQSLAATYPYAVRQPQKNTYGMIMYSRTPLLDHSVEYLTDENVPSIHTQIELQSGDRVMVRAIHPVPPPLADTFRRDAEIMIAGRQCLDSKLPNILLGDLNDVGWSRITRLFQRISGLVDPRVGRGFYASYHAEKPMFRWPLDHVFHDPAFSVGRFELLPYVGSDHFSVLAEIYYEPEESLPDNLPDAYPGDGATAREIIETGKGQDADTDEHPSEK